MLSQRLDISTASDHERTAEYEIRLWAMESALAKLNEKGLSAAEQNVRRSLSMLKLCRQTMPIRKGR